MTGDGGRWTGLADFTATSLASMSANLVTHPFETLKVRQQLADGRSASLVGLARSMVRQEGALSLYRGFAAGMLRAVISGGGRLAIYNQLKLALLDGRGTGDYDGAVRAGLGMASGVLAACVAAPIDLARTRQQAAAAHPGGLAAVLGQLLRQDGVRGLYAGTSAVFARQAVFTAAQLASYDQAKRGVAARTGLPIDGRAAIVLASLASGVCSTLATAPVEMVKTRMQLAGAGAGFAATLTAVVRAEGPLALWRGSTALYLKLAPHTLIVLVMTEWFRTLFGVPQIV